MAREVMGSVEEVVEVGMVCTKREATGLLERRGER